MSRGQLIALEGIDGAGTTTQARLLVGWLGEQRIRSHFTCEPSGGPIGSLVRRVLTHEVRAVDGPALALLFAGDRLDHLTDEIEPRLAHGDLVISDRYVYSSLAYQSLNLDPSWVAAINRRAPEADLTIYLRVDPEVAARRRAARGGTRELFETRSQQARIASLYDSFFGSTPADGSWRPDPRGSAWIHVDRAPPPALQTLDRRPCWAVVDGAEPVDAIQQRLRKLLRETCSAAGLWHSR